MHCQKARDRFLEYADHTLDESTRLTLTKHLDGCVACKKLYQNIEATRGLLQNSGPMPVSSDLKVSLFKKLHQESLTRTQQHTSRQTWIKAAALFLMVLIPLVGWFFWPRQTGPRLAKGTLMLEGKPLPQDTPLPAGKLLTSGDQPVLLTCANGGHIKLAPFSGLRLGQTESDGRQYCLFDHGHLTFESKHKANAFAVEIGPHWMVRDTGTKFTVSKPRSKDPLVSVELLEGHLQAQTPQGHTQLSGNRIALFYPGLAPISKAEDLFAKGIGMALRKELMDLLGQSEPGSLTPGMQHFLDQYHRAREKLKSE